VQVVTVVIKVLLEWDLAGELAKLMRVSTVVPKREAVKTQEQVAGEAVKMEIGDEAEMMCLG